MTWCLTRCDNDVITSCAYGPRCLVTSRSKSLGWSDARQWCRNHSTDGAQYRLISVVNDDVQQSLERFIEEHDFFEENSQVWIGATRSSTNWTWVNGSLLNGESSGERHSALFISSVLPSLLRRFRILSAASGMTSIETL